MAISDEFAELTPNAEAAARALAAVDNALTEYRDRIRSEAERRIDEVLSLIQSSTSTVADRLFAQQQYLQDQLSRLPENDFARRPFELALAQVRELMAVLARAEASAPGFGEALFELQREYEERMRIAQGNTQLMALIEADYQRRRNEILTQGAQSGLTQLANQYREWLNRLMLNDQLSTFTPEQRLAEAERQYNEALASRDASRITSAADAYLREARNFFASGAGYQAIFGQVTGQIGALAGGATFVTPTVTGTPSAGTTSASASSATAANAAAVASAAAAQANSATATIMNSLVQITAEVRNSIDREAQNTRNNDNANTSRLETAIAAPGTVRVVP